MVSPLASVVIPTCKRVRFLEAALASVERARAAASLRADELECIVVDDGHDAETRALCSRAGVNLPVRYETSRHGPRAGPSACRNQGVHTARGEFIYLLDDDDTYCDNRFAKSLPLLRDKGYDMVLEPSLREYVDEPSRPSYITGPCGEPSDAFRFMLTGGPETHITPGATAFRKATFLAAGGYDEHLHYGEDGELLLRLCLYARVALVAGEPVTRIAIHSDNSTRPDRLRLWQNVHALSVLSRKVRRGPWPAQAALTAYELAGKLDFVLTRYRLTAPSYPARLKGGALALWHFDWRCATANNFRTIAVWLTRSRGA